MHFGICIIRTRFLCGMMTCTPLT